MNGWLGFAELYLHRCNQESKSDEADPEIYNKLIDLDKKLGTSALQQLSRCLLHTCRREIIEV